MPETALVAAQPTLGAVLRQATADLRHAGIDQAGNDARRLLAAVLGLSGAQVLSQPERRLSPEQVERFGQLHCPASQPRAGLAHPRRAGVLWPQLRDLVGNARSAPGQRDADRGGARACPPRGMARCAAAHPGRRHRVRLPAADSALRAPERGGYRHGHQRGRIGGGTRQRPPPRCRAPRAVADSGRARGHRRSFRNIGFQSTLRAL